MKREHLPNNQICKHSWRYLNLHYKRVYAFYCIYCKVFSFKLCDEDPEDWLRRAYKEMLNAEWVKE